MKARARQKATYADVISAPEHLIAELIEGDLYTSPRPRAAHARSTFRLGGRLAPLEFGDGEVPGGWIFMNEPELHLEEDVLVPDLGGWRVERLGGTPPTHGVEIDPDWVCEVLSPSNARHDRIVKMPVYAKHGVAYAWIVDVAERTLEVFRLENGRWSWLSTHNGEEPVSAEPFEALVLQPDDIYGPAPVSPAAT